MQTPCEIKNGFLRLAFAAKSLMSSVASRKPMFIANGIDPNKQTSAAAQRAHHEMHDTGSPASATFNKVRL